MTEKRFQANYQGDCLVSVTDKQNHRTINIVQMVELLNECNDKNEQLKIQLQNTSDQRDEFHRGARENANRVGKLEKENEQLKKDSTVLILANQDYRKENEELKKDLEKLSEWYKLKDKSINKRRF